MARWRRQSKWRITEDQLEEFDVILCVAGSRVYNDYDFFREVIVATLELPEFEGKTVCFMTGEAQLGPDDMIITYCDEMEMPFFGMPANWDEYGKRAGYMRNMEMANNSTHLLAFHADKSKGTAHMIKYCEGLGMKPTVVIVDSDETRKKLTEGI
jgi:hypothetical protein